MPSLDEPPSRFAFFLLPGFDLQALAGCVEALGLANRANGCSCYTWTLIGESAAPVPSRAGIALPVDALAGESLAYDRLVICAGEAAAHYARSEVIAWLRRLERRGVALGAVEAGAWLLARAGILGQRAVALHWSTEAAFRESFPEATLSDQRFVLDEELDTAIGGIAAFEMIVERIRREQGDAVAEQIAVSQSATLMPVASALPATGLAQRLRIRNPWLAACLAIMEKHVEMPLSNGELAQRVGLSVRHLERLFRHHLATTPAHFYRTVRLEQAKRLIQQTQMPVTEIAMATGFFSVSHFGRTFREAYGRTPRRLRTERVVQLDRPGAQHLL